MLIGGKMAFIVKELLGDQSNTFQPASINAAVPSLPLWAGLHIFGINENFPSDL